MTSKLIHISLQLLICPHLNTFHSGWKQKEKNNIYISFLVFTNYKLRRLVLEFPNQEC